MPQNLLHNKEDPLTIKGSVMGGGQWRIRTAVAGFADRFLATRTTDQFYYFKHQGRFCPDVHREFLCASGAQLTVILSSEALAKED
jgi:hypothetical protein